MEHLRLRTFDEYWSNRTNPAANEAWDECAEERDAVIKELREDLSKALNEIEDLNNHHIKTCINHFRRKWKLRLEGLHPQN